MTNTFVPEVFQRMFQCGSTSEVIFDSYNYHNDDTDDYSLTKYPPGVVSSSTSSSSASTLVQDNSNNGHVGLSSSSSLQRREKEPSLLSSLPPRDIAVLKRHQQYRGFTENLKTMFRCDAITDLTRSNSLIFDEFACNDNENDSIIISNNDQDHVVQSRGESSSSSLLSTSSSTDQREAYHYVIALSPSKTSKRYLCPQSYNGNHPPLSVRRTQSDSLSQLPETLKNTDKVAGQTTHQE